VGILKYLVFKLFFLVFAALKSSLAIRSLDHMPKNLNWNSKRN